MGVFQADKVKEGRDRIIVVMPCPFKLDTDSKLLMDELTATEVKSRNGLHFSLCGGFTRDSLLGMPFNDYDVASQHHYTYRNELQQTGILVFDEHLPLPQRMRIRQENGPHARPHDYYISPWDPAQIHRPLHWIDAASEGLVHDRFDFSINEFCLKSDGNLYAPTYAWRDLENRIIRLNVRITPTLNNVFRAVRFAAKYDFRFHPVTHKRIKRFVDEHDLIAGPRSVRVVQKIITEGTGNKALEIFQSYGFNGADKCNSIEEFKAHLDSLIERGIIASEGSSYDEGTF